MQNNDALQCLQAQIRSYQQFPCPVIAYAETHQICVGNLQAAQRFPALCHAEAVQSLLAQIPMHDLHQKLRTEGSMRLLAPFGHQILELNVLPLLDGTQIEGLLFFLLQDEQSLVHAQEQQQQLDSFEKMSTAFNAVARESAHEIFNSLESLTLKADIMRANYFKTMFAPLTTNTYRLLRASNHLLLYFRLENQTYQPEFTAQDLTEDLLDFAPLVNSFADRMHMTVEFVLPDTFCFLRADHHLLHMALFNLLHNSFYFARPGNHITVALTQNTDHYLLTVRDTGTGIEPIHLQEVFHPFVSFDPLHRGMGLGLTLVERIVQLHGGEVSIQSTEGKGTTVSLYLPDTTAHLLSLAQKEIQVQLPPESPFSDLNIGLSDALFSPFQSL